MTCGDCGEQFTTTASRPAEYCSPRCKGRAAHARRPKDYKLNHDKICASCGAAFRGQLRSMYCSRACVAKAGWERGRLKPLPRTADRLNYRLLKDYGITRADYEALLAEQNGVCAICGQGSRDASGMRLCVDHDHDTGQVRGLLCSHCNRALGLFRDSQEVLGSAMRYLTARSA